MAATYTLKELADLVSGELSGGGNIVISGFNGLDMAGEGEITFINTSKLAEKLTGCKASACIVPLATEENDLPLIRVVNPDLAAAVIHNHLLARPFEAAGVHPSAVIGTDCHIPDQVSIGPLVCIGNRVRVGERVTVHPGSVIGDDVVIDEDTILHANVTVAYSCTIGKRVVLHHGVVIGSDGFGFATDAATGQHITKPQVGTVRIDDDVEIGANSCVDRAAFGVTWIKAGTRIDNLVMIGHNVEIGENSILVGQAGIAGSTTLGRSVVLGARAGIGGHLHLEDGVMVAAMGGVHNNQPKGAVVGGIPAIEVKKWGRATAAYSRLPELVKEVRRLRKEVDRLAALLAEKEEKE